MVADRSSGSDVIHRAARGLPAVLRLADDLDPHYAQTMQAAKKAGG